MNKIKQLLTRGAAMALAAILLVGLLPTPAQAASIQGSYSIANNYMKYTINTKTGGFCIETIAGHPQKVFDNNLPLLYKEDESRSSGTSFLTVRIDEKDYIFGQDYGWFGIDSALSTPRRVRGRPPAHRALDHQGLRNYPKNRPLCRREQRPSGQRGHFLRGEERQRRQGQGGRAPPARQRA